MGAGESKSKTSMEMINESMTEIVNRNIQGCMVKGKMSQIMKSKCDYTPTQLVEMTNNLANSPVCLKLIDAMIENPDLQSSYNNSCTAPCTNIGNKQDMVATFKMDCLMDTKVSNGIKESIENALNQTSENDTSGIAGLLSDVDNETSVKIKNKIKNAFTNENISESLAEMEMLQIMDMSGTTNIGNEQKMGAEMIVTSMMSNQAINEAVTELANVGDQSSKNKNTGPIAKLAEEVGKVLSDAVDTVGDVAEAGIKMASMFVYIIPVLAIIFVFFVLKGGLGKVASARNAMIPGYGMKKNTISGLGLSNLIINKS